MYLCVSECVYVYCMYVCMHNTIYIYAHFFLVGTVEIQITVVLCTVCICMYV
jgi:hypothetical protein